MSRFFIYHPIAAAVVAILIMLIGAVSALTLPIARYPEIAPPTIEVTATYPGANAVTIGETVATPLEQEVNGVENMLYMSSTSSSDGSMTLSVSFEVGTDLDMANVLVQNRVSTAEAKLPEDVRRQGIMTKKKSPEITFFVTFYSPDGSLDSSFLHNFAKQNVEDEIKRVPGVGDVKTFGTGEFGMRIWLDPGLMKGRDVTTSQVLAAIREQNVQVAAGQIGQPPTGEDQAYQYIVNTTGRFSEPRQFEDIVVKVDAQGRMVYVRDVATVELASKTYDFSAIYKGRPCAAMSIYQLPGANALEVATGVKEKLDELFVGFKVTYQDSLVYEIAYDATSVVSASIEEVISTLFITLILVVLTVYIFLQSFRATIIPAVTIPVALIGTFAALALLGFSINQMTLFGLVLAIGIVVDDAIVVVENCTRLIEEQGMSAKEAAVLSMKQVTGPIVATTMVLLAVFVPTLAMGGITGQLFKQFAVTISIATVFSSINALTLSPALCGILLKKGRPAWGPFKWFNSTLSLSTNMLTGIVKWAIRVGIITLIIFVGLVALALKGFGDLPTGFVPQEDEGYCIVNVQLPEGAALARANKVLLQASKEIEKIEGVRGAIGIGGFSLIDGSAGSNKASFLVTFDDWRVRSEPHLHQLSIVNNINAILAPIQEAVILAFEPPSLPGVGMAGGFSLQLQDRGGAGLGMLDQMATEFINDGNAQSSLQRMFTGFKSTAPQLFVDIDREQVRDRNVELANVFGTLQANLGSAYVNDFLQFGRIYQVRVQALSQYRDDPSDIGALEVTNRNGDKIPLSTFINVEETFGPQIVTHHNIYPSAKINGNAAGGKTSGQAMELLAEMAKEKLPPTMGFEWTDLSYQEAKASTGMALIFLFSIVLVYLVLAFQYESWALPLTVCFAVPGALLGAVAAVMYRNMDNNVYTQVGVVLLIGLSTKTAILIVEFAKEERDRGISIRDAAINATRLRFRAVLMTAFSFILGVIPLLIATGAGAKSQQVLGTTVFGGMLVATVVGVIAVPVLYFIIQKISEFLGGGPKKPEDGEADESDEPEPQPTA